MREEPALTAAFRTAATICRAGFAPVACSGMGIGCRDANESGRPPTIRPAEGRPSARAAPRAGHARAPGAGVSDRTGRDHDV